MSLEKKKNTSLIDKFIGGKASKSQILRLIDWFFSHQKNTSWPRELGSENKIKEHIYNNIQVEIVKSNGASSPVVPFYRHRYFKYAAVTVPLIFSTLYFINKFSLNEKSLAAKPIVNNNNIVVGGSKAVLTVENGTEVVLGDTETSITANVKSTGQSLIYAETTDSKAEINFNYLTIPKGGEYSLVLSDGTKVWLNAQSQLKYPVSFQGNKPREVELIYGEAYFAVTHSNPQGSDRFQVKTANQYVDVLGTEFNVRAYQDEHEIATTLVKGSIHMKTPLTEQRLFPGNQAIYSKENKRLQVVNNVDVFSETSWKEGVFGFDGKSLAEIMGVLERWYDMDVVYANESLKNKKFSGLLVKKYDIEVTLTALQHSNVIKNYEIDDRTVTLK